MDQPDTQLNISPSTKYFQPKEKDYYLITYQKKDQFLRQFERTDNLANKNFLILTKKKIF